MRLPRPRGVLSAMLTDALRRPPHPLADVPRTQPAGAMHAIGGRTVTPAALADEDLQLSLFLCYELHYRGFDGVDDAWEWQPSLLAVRAALEDRFERALRALVDPGPAVPAPLVPRALKDLAAADGGPGLAGYLQRRATAEQFREFLTHRSIYHLKEADPHTWAIPRLSGRTKAALVEIQADEYGGGRADRMHASLFATTMRALGLDDSYGRYVDDVPAITLATGNLISLFGLHRRRRGALLGHLAAFELTSSLPNRRYGNGLRRLGGDPDATRFFDEHVEADAVHEQIAAYDLCGGFAEEHPDAAPDVLFGAACCLALDGLFATHVLDAWERGETSHRADAAPQVCA
jgi:hypothetical protein